MAAQGAWAYRDVRRYFVNADVAVQIYLDPLLCLGDQWIVAAPLVAARPTVIRPKQPGFRARWIS